MRLSLRSLLHASSLLLLSQIDAVLAQNVSDTFYLHTALIQGPTRFSGLTLETYHTGAGQSDIVLVPYNATQSSRLPKGYLNNTYFNLDLGTPFSWGVVLDPATNYAAWESTSVQAGDGAGTPGFAFDPTGRRLIWQDEQFAGWLVCDWSHGLPQLFWRVNASAAGDMTKPIDSCAFVDLVRVNTTSACQAPTQPARATPSPFVG